MAGPLGRVEPHVVAAHAPVVAVAGEHVGHGERRGRAEVGGHGRDALVRVVGSRFTTADHVVARAARVRDQRLVVRLEQHEAGEALERRVVAADPVETPEERQQRPIEPALRRSSVLLGVQVLLRAGAHRLVLVVLEAGVDAPRRRERRGEHGARGEGGRPPCTS